MEMVHGDRGQRRNGQSSPATPFGLAFIGVGEQRPHPPAIQSREGLRASRSVRPGLRPLPKPSPCGQRSLGSSERRRTSRGALDKRPQRVVPASVGVYRRGLQGPLHVDFTRFAKPPVRVRYLRIGVLRGVTRRLDLTLFQGAAFQFGLCGFRRQHSRPHQGRDIKPVRAGRSRAEAKAGA
jgi:hypothetical protein